MIHAKWKIFFGHRARTAGFLLLVALPTLQAGVSKEQADEAAAFLFARLGIPWNHRRDGC
jgi:hypothetical protein